MLYFGYFNKNVQSFLFIFGTNCNITVLLILVYSVISTCSMFLNIISLRVLIICLHWPRQRQFVYYHSQLHYNIFSFLFSPFLILRGCTMQSAREKRLGPPAGAYSLPHRRKKKIPNQYHILTCTLTLLPYMYIHFFCIFSFPTSLHFFFLLYNLVLGRRDAFYTSRRRSLGVYAVLVHLIASVSRS